MQAFEKLVITLEAPPRIGGVATYLSCALEAARKNSYQVGMAAPLGSFGAQVTLGCGPTHSPWNLFRAAMEFKKIRSDCFYLSEAAAIRAAISFAGWDWCRKQKIRLILHGSEVLELAHLGRFHQLLHHAERIYTLSRTVADLVLAIDRSFSKKIIITGGAPSPSLTLIEGLKDPQRLLTVARLHPRKGQIEVISALAEGKLPGFSYDIAGPSRNHLYQQKLISLSKSCARGSVRFHGNVDNGHLSLLYSQNAIFVLPAKLTPGRIEGYGLCLWDAAAMGCIVVAYDCGGISEIVQHCKTGFLVPPGDRNTLAETITQIANDECLRTEISFNATTLAHKQSWGIVAEKLFAL